MSNTRFAILSRWMGKAALSAALCLLALSGGGCKKGEDGAEEKAAAQDSAKPRRNPLSIQPSDELLGQLKVGEPTWADVAAQMRLAGRLEADETRIARVNSPVAGRIIELEVVEGQNVRRGQLIATIRSTELSDAQSEFLKAQSQQRLAERAVDRAKRLLEADVIGEAEVQRRDAELVQANAEVSASRDQLRVLGMSEDAIARLETSRVVNSISQVLATIDGTVIERKATIGQVVQPAEAVCVLADLSRIWLVADVPEQSAGAVEVGQSVEAEIPALPGPLIRGKLSFVSATVNPETRTVRIRMDLTNPARRYKPAMLATMTLKDAGARTRVVPASAVVREGSLNYVFIEKVKGTFELRPVTLGEEFEEVFVLEDGIANGERIVLDGAFHLNNERKRVALQGE